MCSYSNRSKKKIANWSKITKNRWEPNLIWIFFGSKFFFLQIDWFGSVIGCNFRNGIEPITYIRGAALCVLCYTLCHFTLMWVSCIFNFVSDFTDSVPSLPFYTVALATQSQTPSPRDRRTCLPLAAASSLPLAAARVSLSLLARVPSLSPPRANWVCSSSPSLPPCSLVAAAAELVLVRDCST